jgi:hypothetical protein
MSIHEARSTAMKDWYAEERKGVDPEVLADIGYTPPTEADAAYKEMAAVKKKIESKHAARAAITATAVAEIEQQYRLTGTIDTSPEAIAERTATNQTGRAAATEAWNQGRDERNLPPIS